MLPGFLAILPKRDQQTKRNSIVPKVGVNYDGECDDDENQSLYIHLLVTLLTFCYFDGSGYPPDFKQQKASAPKEFKLPKVG